METGGGADRAWSEVRNAAGGRGTVVGVRGGGKGIVNGWSSKVDDVSTAGGETRGGGAPEYTGGTFEDVGGGRCTEGAPEYASGTPVGVGGGEACVEGG
ncbi:hypothetical protein CDL15_Pgr012274 [Punica granatum]|uniref:Uncharacterized protein n=1 Tax=Punica granatum TaxID=22663 RepID=A0A218WR33_PUNGR|nr:hypothetical protein CDL15_Pgr012274 [Punica granatum]